MTFLNKRPLEVAISQDFFSTKQYVEKHVITFHTAMQCFSLNQVFSLQTIITSDNDYTL